MKNGISNEGVRRIAQAQGDLDVVGKFWETEAALAPDFDSLWNVMEEWASELLKREELLPPEIIEEIRGDYDWLKLVNLGEEFGIQPVYDVYISALSRMYDFEKTEEAEKDPWPTSERRQNLPLKIDDAYGFIVDDVEQRMPAYLPLLEKVSLDVVEPEKWEESAGGYPNALAIYGEGTSEWGGVIFLNQAAVDQPGVSPNDIEVWLAHELGHYMWEAIGPEKRKEWIEGVGRDEIGAAGLFATDFDLFLLSIPEDMKYSDLFKQVMGL